MREFSAVIKTVNLDFGGRFTDLYIFFFSKFFKLCTENANCRNLLLSNCTGYHFASFHWQFIKYKQEVWYGLRGKQFSSSFMALNLWFFKTSEFHVRIFQYVNFQEIGVAERRKGMNISLSIGLCSRAVIDICHLTERCP